MDDGDVGEAVMRVSRRYRQQARVWCAPDGDPVRFAGRRGDYRVVAVLARWIDAPPWWRGTGSAAVDRRDVWRVEARRGHGATAVVDLVRVTDPAHGPPRWWLAAVWD